MGEVIRNKKKVEEELLDTIRDIKEKVEKYEEEKKNISQPFCFCNVLFLFFILFHLLLNISDCVKELFLHLLLVSYYFKVAINTLLLLSIINLKLLNMFFEFGIGILHLLHKLSLILKLIINNFVGRKTFGHRDFQVPHLCRLVRFKLFHCLP